MGLGLGLGHALGLDTFISLGGVAPPVGPVVDITTNGFFEDEEVLVFAEDGIFRWNPFTNTMGSSIVTDWSWQGCYDFVNEVIWYFHSTTGDETAINQIRKVNVDGTGKTTVFTDGAGGASWDANSPLSMVFDHVNDIIYFINGSSAATAATFQQDVASYSGATDTFMRASAPTTNFGSTDPLEVDGSGDEGALLKWVISTIPAGSTVTSVSVTLNITNVSTTAGYFFKECLRAWVEGQATWNIYSTGNSWQTAGCNGALDVGATSFGTLTAASTGAETVVLNAAGIAAVQGWVDDPSSNNGFLLANYDDANWDGSTFTSKENATAADHPKLTVGYNTPRSVIEFTTDGTTTVPDDSSPYLSGATNTDNANKLAYDGINERLYVSSIDDFEVNIFDISTQASPSFIKAITEATDDFQGAIPDIRNNVVYLARATAATPVRAWSYASATRYLLGDCGGTGSVAFGDIHFCHGRGCIISLASPGTYGTKFDLLWPNHPMDNTGGQGNVLQATINTITGTGDRITGMALVPATTWDSNPYPIRLDEFALGTPVLYYLKSSDDKIYSNNLAVSAEVAVSTGAYSPGAGAVTDIQAFKFDHVANVLAIGQGDNANGQATIYDIAGDSYTDLITSSEVNGVSVGAGFGGSARPWGMSGFNHPFNDVGELLWREGATLIEKRIYDNSVAKTTVVTQGSSNYGGMVTLLSGWNGRNFITYYGQHTGANTDLYRSASGSVDPWASIGTVVQISNNDDLQGVMASINTHVRWPELVTVFKNGGNLGTIPGTTITATAIGLHHTTSSSITLGATAADAAVDLGTALSVSGTVSCLHYDPVNEILYWTDGGGFKKCNVSMFEAGTAGNYIQPIVGTPTTIDATPGFVWFAIDWKFEDGSANDVSLGWHGEYP
jgi:hypothetical protein